MIALERVGQAIMDHRVDEADRAHLSAAAQHLGMGGERHAFLAAGDHDAGVAGFDRLCRERDGAQARPAQLVKADGGALDRDAGVDGGLAGGVLALARGEDLAQDHLVHFFGRDGGLCQRGEDGLAAQFMCRCRAEGAHETAHGGTLGGGNDDV